MSISLNDHESRIVKLENVRYALTPKVLMSLFTPGNYQEYKLTGISTEYDFVGVYLRFTTSTSSVTNDQKWLFGSTSTGVLFNDNQHSLGSISTSVSGNVNYLGASSWVSESFSAGGTMVSAGRCRAMVIGFKLTKVILYNFSYIILYRLINSIFTPLKFFKKGGQI